MNKQDDAVLEELRAIKMLTMLQLMRGGTKQSQIAAILGVSERTLGRMLPKGAAKGSATPASDEVI